ncbi:uncharacterized protein NPIL_191971 [Nephila pilipes]|uniref:Uncharacterized protein n=1 Tax=Nephila pilipes TaxID=299642 RepID=A0A8X6R2P1_NEPPI|nr:uncharacterized protein NPIL_191971 [Nephila pilipes]
MCIYTAESKSQISLNWPAITQDVTQDDTQDDKQRRTKVKHILSDEDEDVEYLIPKNIAKKKPTHAAFDLNLSPPSTSVDELKIQPYSIYLGKGVGVEIKEFRKSYYVAFSKTVDGDETASTWLWINYRFCLKLWKRWLNM